MNHLTDCFRPTAKTYAFVLAVFTFLLAGLFIPVVLQGQPSFAPAVENPFGQVFTPAENDLVFHALVDIDNDGDLDDFVSHRTYFSPCWLVAAFHFYQNTGTSECPEYTLMAGETFGLPPYVAAITFADLDNDGDQDAVISDHCASATLKYYENEGTAAAPAFSNTAAYTFNTSGWNISYAMLNFGDLDGDGDLDALVNGMRSAVFKYLENTGTPESFNFSTPVNDPFGLSIPSFNSSEWSHFWDWDCDGDLDILNGHWQGGNHNNWKLYIHENVGTKTAPAFTQAWATEQLIMPISIGDMDGDGDMDIFADEYYFRNIMATGCVTFPTVAFNAEQSGYTLTFHNNSTAQTTDCQAPEYLWAFGDGATSTEMEPSHTYLSFGTYQVCLTVKDIAGSQTVC
ncbi:MAG: PKD domain-containing protein, partial [Bacteroidetes bacterium]